MGSLFIDESGDLGLRGSKYLVLAALFVKEERPLNRIIKNMRRNTFRKELRKANEIKANKSSAKLIMHLLKELGKLKGANVLFVVLEKKKIMSAYLKNNKHKLYNYVAGKLAANLSFSADCSEIRIDKSKGKQLLQKDFNTHLLKNLSATGKKPVIFHSHSHAWGGLQFADVLAWACFQKFEHNNPAYLDAITIERGVYYVW